MTDVSKIENFVDRLESLAGAYELSESFRKAISRCKLSITMYKMSDKYADEVLPPVECADQNATTESFSSWNFIQNFIALPDDERDQFVAILQKLLTVKK